MAHVSPSARPRLAVTAAVAVVGLTLAGCTSEAPAPADQSPTAAPASTPAATAEETNGAAESTEDPIAAAASQAAAEYAAEMAQGTQRPTPREALETVGAGVNDGAATAGWQSTAAGRSDTVSVQNCVRDVLNQDTMDAIATHIPNANAIEIMQLFAARDTDYEFLTCSFSTQAARAEGMPTVLVRYQHNLNGERLDWCREDAPVVADEYTFDPETHRGLMSLLRPGMVGGTSGASLLPQRTGWACTEDGTQMVGITFGAAEGFGDSATGLSTVDNSPVADSTTVVTQARDQLADTWLSDPSQVQEVIGRSSPFFMDYQMDEATLQEALRVPTAPAEEGAYSDQSLIERPEGAPGPIAPGQPPRPATD
ncbi:MAG: hypothetical protein Q4G34_02560 [Micrococcus sp.]|nr:hypothetical protein [Micrococcus sp.]